MTGHADARDGSRPMTSIALNHGILRAVRAATAKDRRDRSWRRLGQDWATTRQKRGRHAPWTEAFVLGLWVPHLHLARSTSFRIPSTRPCFRDGAGRVGAVHCRISRRAAVSPRVLVRRQSRRRRGGTRSCLADGRPPGTCVGLSRAGLSGRRALRRHPGAVSCTDAIPERFSVRPRKLLDGQAEVVAK